MLGVKAYVGYLFHHESPLRKPTHVSQMIASAARRIADGSSEKIEIGNITVEKEWTYAEDVVAGMLTLVEQDKVYEAVISSGRAYTIQHWLECCFEAIGSDWRRFVLLKEKFTPEYPRLVTDPRTINHLGWSPRIGIGELAEMMVGKSVRK